MGLRISTLAFVRIVVTIVLIGSTLVLSIAIGQLAAWEVLDGASKSWNVTLLAIGLFGFALSLGKILIDAFAQANRQSKEMHAQVQWSRGLCPTCGYDIRAADERCPECGEALPEEMSNPAQTPAIRRIIRAAVRESRDEKAGHVGSEHVLLALMAEPDSVAAVVLNNLGVTDANVRDCVDELMADVRSAETP